MRFHKFKQSSEPHDFYYSEQLLYYPHTCNERLFPDDLDMCKKYYEEINYVKSKERVKEGQIRATEIVKDEEAIANLLDPQKEQDDEDCEGEGIEAPKEFVALDPDMIGSNKIEI